jgi:tRNA pseudouridine38/39 synthase
MDVANVKNFVRTILFFSVEAESPPAGAASSVMGRLMSLNVRGNAFLYHQVRCMASVLFTIGRRHEPPSLIDTLLDVATLPRKPAYEMAAEEPLLFFACGYEDGTLPPPRRGAGRTRGILAAHLRAEARRAAVRAAVVRAAADAVAAAETAEDRAGDPAIEPLAEARHVPFMSRLREASYEEQWAKYSAKAAARGEAEREGEDEG